MKKLFALMMALLMVFALAACGGEEEATTTENGETTAEITGEVYDAGEVNAIAPEGWKAFGHVDVFAEDGAMDTNSLSVCKGGETDLDLMTKPYIRFDYYGPSIEMMTPTPDFYDDVVDIEPLTTGDHTWNGFTCDSMGTKMAILWADEGEHQYQASLVLAAYDGDTISLEDADVQAILASVTPSAQ